MAVSTVSKAMAVAVVASLSARFGYIALTSDTPDQVAVKQDLSVLVSRFDQSLPKDMGDGRRLINLTLQGSQLRLVVETDAQGGGRDPAAHRRQAAAGSEAICRTEFSRFARNGVSLVFEYRSRDGSVAPHRVFLPAERCI